MHDAKWHGNKFVVLFKKGNSLQCKNYRGKAITDILFRIFDNILEKRLLLWSPPSKEQAGAQKGRSCVNHIMTLRFLIDYAKKSRVKLYILFVDFEKAYDNVSRSKLIEELKYVGCGKIMIKIIVSIYKNTNLIFKSANVCADKGVKQGSSTTCLFFILYVDRTIKMVNEYSQADGFLGGLHILMLMDGTVLLSTSKEGITEKFKMCQSYCSEYGMSVNQPKTKFMVINGDLPDSENIISGSIIVKYRKSAKYMGTFITDEGCYRNPELPFTMKKRVVASCVLSCLLYGCKTWFCNRYGKLESTY